ADHVAAVSNTLILLQGGGLFLLLIGAVNLINLVLVRASAQAREAAIRHSLGAERRHLIHKALVETSLLGLIGGIIGLGVAALGLGLLRTFGVNQLPLGMAVQLDARVAVIGLMGAVIMGVL